MKSLRLIFGLLLGFVLQAAWFAARARKTGSHPAHLDSRRKSRHSGIERRLLRFALNGNSRRCSALGGGGRYCGWNASFLALSSPSQIRSVPFDGEFGSGHLLTVTHPGCPASQTSSASFAYMTNQPWGDIRVSVSNSTAESHRSACHSRGEDRHGRYCAIEWACLGGPHSLRRLQGKCAVDEADGSRRGGQWPPPGVWTANSFTTGKAD